METTRGKSATTDVIREARRKVEGRSCPRVRRPRCLLSRSAQEPTRAVRYLEKLGPSADSATTAAEAGGRVRPEQSGAATPTRSGFDTGLSPRTDALLCGSATARSRPHRALGVPRGSRCWKPSAQAHRGDAVVGLLCVHEPEQLYRCPIGFAGEGGAGFLGRSASPPRAPSPAGAGGGPGETRTPDTRFRKAPCKTSVKSFCEYNCVAATPSGRPVTSVNAARCLPDEAEAILAVGGNTKSVYLRPALGRDWGAERLT